MYAIFLKPFTYCKVWLVNSVFLKVKSDKRKYSMIFTYTTVQMPAMFKKYKLK